MGRLRRPGFLPGYSAARGMSPAGRLWYVPGIRQPASPVSTWLPYLDQSSLYRNSLTAVLLASLSIKCPCVPATKS